MKRIFLFLTNVWALTIIAQSPITLGNSNMPGSGDTLRFTNFQVGSAGNYTLTGTSFNWDFSQVVSTTEGVRSFKSAIQTPYALFFLSTNEYGEKIADTIGAGPLTMTKYYNFYKKQNSPNAFIADGVGLTYSSVPVPSYYSDKDELYFFPMSYPKYDSSSFKFSTALGGLLPITYTKAGYRVTVVDGWGTITTPYGTENCLRLITTQYAMDSIKNTILPIPLGFPNYQRSYQWMTLSSKIPYLEITGNLLAGNFTPTQARYRGYKKENTPVGIVSPGGSGEVTLYPNPVREQLKLSGNTREIYELYDLQGRKIMDIKADLSGAPATLDVSGLKAGTYMVRVADNGQERYLKFIKE